MKNVMTKAWEIAKEGQKKFGGKVKEYFAQALRMAWAIIKKGGVAMKGSEKQVKRAEDIKKRALRMLELNERNMLMQAKGDQPTMRKIVRMTELMKEEVERIEDAKTFINARAIQDMHDGREAFKVIEKMFDNTVVVEKIKAEFK